MNNEERRRAKKAIRKLKKSAIDFEERAVPELDFIIPGTSLNFKEHLLDSTKQIRETIKVIQKELNSD